MKRMKIEMYRMYFKFLIASTDYLLARKERREERHARRENSCLTECGGQA